MMIGYKIFPTLGAFLAAALLVAGCSPRPRAVPATPVEIREKIDSSKGPLTLVHVWATWCDPCREEFPELMEVYRDQRGGGMQLILISADEPGQTEQVEQFLQQQGSPVGSLVSTELSQTFIETLSPNWSGALPASFFFDSTGKLVAEWEGKRTKKHYAETIEQLINQPKGTLQ